MDEKKPPLDESPFHGRSAGQPKELTEEDLDQLAGGADPAPPIFVGKDPPDGTGKIVIRSGDDIPNYSMPADESGVQTGTISGRLSPYQGPAK